MQHLTTRPFDPRPVRNGLRRRDPAALDALAWVQRRARWERRLTELHAGARPGEAGRSDVLERQGAQGVSA